MTIGSRGPLVHQLLESLPYPADSTTRRIEPEHFPRGLGDHRRLGPANPLLGSLRPRLVHNWRTSQPMLVR